MSKKTLRVRFAFIGGLFVILLGLASSFGLRPAQALAPMIAVVGGLAALSVMSSGGGPRAFM
ncbi:MAG TPA: hypothetical protein ENN51_07110 [candidate division WOR-3 bacterium]|uniref:Uncharacterized protein n=1 Tax=candidate division WOR-3 bacterium TaxID=2052148 RepID=A0A7V0T6U2_UNCW3|nr:hypothetical protein [candidate division WOR-3 bacterium]